MCSHVDVCKCELEVFWLQCVFQTLGVLSNFWICWNCGFCDQVCFFILDISYLDLFGQLNWFECDSAQNYTCVNVWSFANKKSFQFGSVLRWFWLFKCVCVFKFDNNCTPNARLHVSMFSLRKSARKESTCWKHWNVDLFKFGSSLDFKFWIFQILDAFKIDLVRKLDSQKKNFSLKRDDN